jgi:hypothetical protein
MYFSGNPEHSQGEGAFRRAARAATLLFRESAFKFPGDSE